MIRKQSLDRRLGRASFLRIDFRLCDPFRSSSRSHCRSEQAERRLYSRARTCQLLSQSLHILQCPHTKCPELLTTWAQHRLPHEALLMLGVLLGPVFLAEVNFLSNTPNRSLIPGYFVISCERSSKKPLNSPGISAAACWGAVCAEANPRGADINNAAKTPTNMKRIAVPLMISASRIVNIQPLGVKQR